MNKFGFNQLLYLNGGAINQNNTLSVYRPYISYSWATSLQDGVIVSKNIGSGKAPLKWYSGNPLDFQGSQYIPVNIDISTLSSISFSVNTAKTCGIISDNTWSRYIVVGANSGRDIEVRLGNLGIDFTFSSTTSFLNKNTNICITLDKILMLAYCYIDGILVDTKQFTSLPSGYFTYIAKETANRYLDGTIDYLVLSSSQLTPTQIQQSYTNPNAFYYEMVKGASSANTLFCTDFGGIGGYIPNDVNKSIGSELDNGNINGTYTSSISQRIIQFNLGLHIKADKKYLVEIEYDDTVNSIITGYKCYGRIDGAIGGSRYENVHKNIIPFVNGTSGVAYYILDTPSTYLEDTSATEMYAWVTTNDSTGTLTADFSLRSLKEISGIYPITNYSATQRTNYQTETTGMQELMIERDSLGFFLGLRDYPKGNGVGYADTGYVISGSEEELSLEIVIKPKVETYYHKYVQSEVNKLTIQTFPNVNTLAFYWFSANMNFTFMEDIPYVFTLVKDSVSSSLYVNGVLTVTKDVKQFSSIKNVVLFTEYGTHNYCPSGEIGLFKVHQKALTQEKITENYTDYIIQGLLAPDNAIQDENGNYLLDENLNYITE